MTSRCRVTSSILLTVSKQVTGFHFTDALLKKDRNIINVNIGNNNNRNNDNETKLEIIKISRINACNKALSSLEQFTNYMVLLKRSERLCCSRRDLPLHLNIKPLLSCNLERHFAVCPR